MPDKNTFLQGEYGIPPNAELTFFDGIHEHKDIIAIANGPTRTKAITLMGKLTSLSDGAGLAFHWLEKSQATNFQGPAYWMYKGRTLKDLEEYKKRGR